MAEFLESGFEAKQYKTPSPLTTRLERRAHLATVVPPHFTSPLLGKPEAPTPWKEEHPLRAVARDPKDGLAIFQNGHLVEDFRPFLLESGIILSHGQLRTKVHNTVS
jgi:hypothetical protein